MLACHALYQPWNPLHPDIKTGCGDTITEGEEEEAAAEEEEKGGGGAGGGEAGGEDIDYSFASQQDR